MKGIKCCGECAYYSMGGAKDAGNETDSFYADCPHDEAEPVIHCKDCAFWESKRVSCEGLARCRTGESGYRYRFGHDFCSRAQKREEVSEDAAD